MSRHHHSVISAGSPPAPTTGTFGNQALTSTAQATPANNFLFGQTFACALSGKLTAMHAYVSGHGTAQTFQADVYSVDGSGNPQSLLGTSTNQITVGAAQAAGYVTFSFTGVTVTAGASYFLALESGTASAGANVWYQTTGGTGFYRASTFGSPPSTFGAYSTETRVWCFYADVTVAGTGGGVGASPGSVLAAVSCGGPPVGGWAGDTDAAPSPFLTAGNPLEVSSQGVGHSIDLTDASVAAPANASDDPTALQQMLASERYDTTGTITYTIPGLPTGAVTVQFWASENYPPAQTVGGRTVDYAVNGSTVDAAEDTFADVGAYRGACYSFAATSTGTLTCSVVHNAGAAVHLSGLRVLAGTVVGPAPGGTPAAGTLAVTSAAPPNATAGVPYSYQLTAGGNGDTAFAWAVTSGSLPTGLTLSAAGSLSGTPSGSGASTFGVTVTGTPSAATATASYTLTVQTSGSAKYLGGSTSLTNYTAYPRINELSPPAAATIPGGGVTVTTLTAAAIQTAIDNNPSATIIKLVSGTYVGGGVTIVPKSSDQIWGVSATATILDNCAIRATNGASGVTVANLTVRNYTAGSLVQGGIDADLNGSVGASWQVLNCQVYNCNLGIALGPHNQAVNCYVHDNVQGGFAGGGVGSLFQYCASVHNNTGNHADGGNKSAVTNGTQWLNCYFADNGISNLWLDVTNQNAIIQSCIFVRGNFIGFMDEINAGNNRIQGCISAGNGGTSTDWQASGIVLSTSHNDTVSGCYVFGNTYTDISCMDQSGSRGSTYGNNVIQNNTLSKQITNQYPSDTRTGNTVLAVASINVPAIICGPQV